MLMNEIDEIKERFMQVELEQKRSFIDSLTALFEEKELEWGNRYDNAAVEEKLALLNGSMELRQLIYALKGQALLTSRKPYDEGNAVWLALSRYFDAIES